MKSNGRYKIWGIVLAAILVVCTLTYMWMNNRGDEASMESVKNPATIDAQMILPGYVIEDVFTLGDDKLLLLQVSQDRAMKPKLQLYDIKSNKVTKEIDNIDISLKNIALEVSDKHISFLTSKNVYSIFDMELNKVKEVDLDGKLMDAGPYKVYAISNDLKKMVYVGSFEENEEKLNALFIMDNDSGESKMIKKLNGGNQNIYLRNLYFTPNDQELLFFGDEEREGKESGVYGFMKLNGDITQSERLPSESTYKARRFRNKVMFTASESGIAGKTNPSKNILTIDLFNKNKVMNALDDPYESYQTITIDDTTISSYNSYENKQVSTAVSTLELRIYQGKKKWHFTGKELKIEEGYDITSFRSFIYNNEVNFLYHSQDYNKQYMVKAKLGD